jgi:hypothetical protein
VLADCDGGATTEGPAQSAEENLMHDRSVVAAQKPFRVTLALACVSVN